MINNEGEGYVFAAKKQSIIDASKLYE
jgi:hypothetical protein